MYTGYVSSTPVAVLVVDRHTGSMALCPRAIHVHEDKRKYEKEGQGAQGCVCVCVCSETQYENNNHMRY